jgi:biopolymer transport protein ExbB
MNLTLLAAAAGEAAPENKFGFVEAMKEGGPVAWTILAVLVIMSVGSFYIMFTKLFEQNKILGQYKTVQSTFWRAASLKEGAAKLEKNGAWRQIADDAVKAQEDHGKMTDSLESHDYMHGSLQRSEDWVRPRRSSACSAR